MNAKDQMLILLDTQRIVVWYGKTPRNIYKSVCSGTFVDLFGIVDKSKLPLMRETYSYIRDELEEGMVGGDGPIFPDDSLAFKEKFNDTCKQLIAIAFPDNEYLVENIGLRYVIGALLIYYYYYYLQVDLEVRRKIAEDMVAEAERRLARRRLASKQSD